MVVTASRPEPHAPRPRQGVVDAHTHVFPPEVRRNRAAFVARDPWFALLYADPTAALADADALLATMATAGVARSLLCGFPWADLGLCRAANDALAADATRAGGRLSWLASVPPHLGSAAAAEADRCLALGASGLGELNADAQGFDLAAPTALAPVVEVCLGRDVPLLLHASEPVGHAYRGKGTATPERLLPFLAAYPALRVVLAHWGGGLPFYELMPEVAAVAANVVYDSAASSYLYRSGVFRAVLDIVGPERVLFGSDHPVLRQDRFLRRVEEEAGLSPVEATAVLGGNARRVYALPVFAPDRASAVAS